MTTTDPVGARVLEARQARGLTQRELGAKVGMPERTISRIENGVTVARRATLAKIAEALDMDLADFVGTVGDPAETPAIAERLDTILDYVKSIDERVAGLEANFLAMFGPLADDDSAGATPEGYASTELEPVRTLVRDVVSALRAGAAGDAAPAPASAPASGPRRQAQPTPPARSRQRS